jgi:hypothetical protein
MAAEVWFDECSTAKEIIGRQKVKGKRQKAKLFGRDS